MSLYLAQISMPYMADEVFLQFIINLHFITNQEDFLSFKVNKYLQTVDLRLKIEIKF